MNIHIQDPKVSLDNFDLIVAPEHDNLDGKNVLKSKGAIHYLRNNELNENENYLKSKINKEKVIALIVGSPKRSRIEVDKRLNDTKFDGDEIIVPSNKNRLIFSSALRFFTKNGPLGRYANSSTCPGVSTNR